MVSLVVQVAVFAASVLGLALGARGLVDATVSLARRLGVSNVVVGLTVVAAGTSMPEIVVTADAAVVGLGDVAVGNVAGSSIFNLAIVLGVLATIRAVPVRRAFVRRDGVVLLAATGLFAAVVLDRVVTRVEGAILLVAFVAYTTYLLRGARAGTAAASTESRPAAAEGRSASTDGSSTSTADDPPVPVRVADPVGFGVRDAALLVGALAVVLVSGHFLVESAVAIAGVYGLSDALVGGTIVAAGTSAPEFAVSLVALARGRTGVSVGNVVGSNVFNVLAVAGVGALARPMTVTPAVVETVTWLVALVAVVVALMWSGRQVSRGEGVLFSLSEGVRWVLGILGVVG
ncbi:calcium/sodium antiporter [Halorubellus litoreus]|uniref:Calcium/sodium antiporter n=1 Tax=Halorubellus litoreus TaxID=755308 RepID=A0ABD5VAQ9_9EURY